jgi:hypothetical protein
MKISETLKRTAFGLLLILGISSCNENVTEFGFDGQISGTIKDQSGNIVAGDVTSNTLVVKALAQGDIVSLDIRVKGDGTFQNTKLYPNLTKFWVTGPVAMVGDTLSIDLSDNHIVQHDFVVVPFLTVKPPVVVGSPTATSISVSYEIIPNDGNVPNLRQVYCSTVPYPNSSTGDGPQYVTKTVSVTTDTGNADITGLTSKTKYYIRVGARATGSSVLNYSDQIEVTTP